MSSHDWAYGELDVEAAWREEAARNYELLDWEREQLADRLGRDDPIRALCVICGSRGAKAIYGLKCAGCFDAQREERDAA